MDHEINCFNEVRCESKRRRTCYKVTIMDLPTVIMAEIISRLPIKSMFCCKCVCKPWYTLSSDPLFVNMHHSRSSRFPCLLLSVNDSITSILELKDHYDYDSNPQNRPIMLCPTYKFGVGFIKPKLKMVGSCNGFICLLNGKTSDSKHSLYISNPLLGEYCKLKLPKWGVSRIVYGFCFIESSGQFKVLRSVTKRVQGGQEVTELEVYTLGVDKKLKWRNVGKAPYPRQESLCDVNVNGSIHWLDSKDYERKATIYSFHICKEEVKSLPPPPGLKPKYRISLVELRNCLCLIDNVFKDNCYYVDIWEMKEYEISESWTKCYHHLSDIIQTRYFYESYKPILIWKDGEILMQCQQGAQLVSYNRKTKQLSEVEVYGGGRASARYVPSFYSLNTILGDNFEVSNVYP